jgi:hypothetical protein
MLSKIKQWYQGKPQHGILRHGSSINTVVIGYNRHWTSEIVNYFVAFLKDNKKQIFVAVLAVLVGVFLFHYEQSQSTKQSSVKIQEANK